MRRDVDVDESASFMVNHHKDIEETEGRRDDHKQVTRHDAFSMIGERCRPDALMIRVKTSCAGYFLPARPITASLPRLTASTSGGEGRPKGRQSDPVQGEEKRLEEPRLGVA